MNKFKLYNTIRKELKNAPNIQKHRFSYKLLNELAEKYKCVEVTCICHCCCGEDTVCWYDIEGYDYGWMWVDYENSLLEQIMPSKLQTYIKKILKLLKDDIYKRNIYICEDELRVVVVIPAQDLTKENYYITYAKTANLDVGYYEYGWSEV